MWCETLRCRISERDFLVRKKCNAERAAHAGTFSITTEHQPDCTHTTQAQWPFAWHVLDVQKLSEQVARHLETLDEGLKPTNSSHATLPGEKEGYLQ